MATKYARDAVKQKGADVTTPINKVTVSPSGNITGFPAGTLTQLHNNTWSENLTDDQFLKLMKEATGLTYYLLTFIFLGSSKGSSAEEQSSNLLYLLDFFR